MYLPEDVQLDMHKYKAPRLPKHNKLCHGDFVPMNVIITPDDKAYVLDWSHATHRRTHFSFFTPHF